MAMEQILREKRKALGLTQEQVAVSLGVTTPAVNKWEKGATCPDIALLPALARLLRTDPNTLLCFQESLSDREVALFLNEIAEQIRTEGFAAGFSRAIEKTREYPQCGQLAHMAALVLDGALAIESLPKEEAETYEAQITALYERVAQGEDAVLAHRARYLLAAKLLQQGAYAKAQAMLDLIPAPNLPDKRLLQADILVSEEKNSEAAALLEHMALGKLEETLMIVVKLLPVLLREGNAQAAQQLAAACQAQYEAFGLWPYSALLAPMQLAVARRDTAESIALISAMLKAVTTPWDVTACPLYSNLSTKAGPSVVFRTFLSPLLKELQGSPAYDFLRGEPAFQQLLSDYAQKAETTSF